jgi:tetratricopeptide (TPR) repeat protein
MWALARARRRHRRALRLWQAGHRAGALAAAETAVAGLGAAERPAALVTLGDLRFQLGRPAAAAEAFRAAGAPGLVPLGPCLRVLGRYAEAEAALAAAPPHPATRNAMGVLCKELRRYPEAAAHYAAALADPALFGAVHHNLAGLAHARGRHRAALVAARTALVWHARERGPGSTEVAADAAVLGAVLLELGRYDDAAAALRRAHDIWRARFGPEHAEARWCRRVLAVVERRQAGG